MVVLTALYFGGRHGQFPDSSEASTCLCLKINFNFYNKWINTKPPKSGPPFKFVLTMCQKKIRSAQLIVVIYCFIVSLIYLFNDSPFPSKRFLCMNLLLINLKFYLS